jgi:uncharacterized membrane protein
VKKIPKKLFSWFLQGLLALLPVVVAGYAIYFLFRITIGIVDGVVRFLPLHLLDIPYIEVLTQAAAVVVLGVFLIIFGLLIKTIVGRSIVRLIDKLVNFLPGINSIYVATKQVISIFLLKKKKFLMRPVLAEYPSENIWVVAFMTGNAGKQYSPDSTEPHYSVFVPTTPNPTSGYLCILPEKKIRPLDVSVEDAIKMVLTGGMVQSE